MRTLLALSSLLLVLAAAVWVRTFRTDGQESTEADLNTGVLFVGIPEPADAPLEHSLALDADSVDSQPSAPEDVTTAQITNPIEALEADRAAPTEAAFTPEPQPISYKVGEGESLWGIIQKHYGKVGEPLIKMVAKANGLNDPSMLRPGMVLVLPPVQKEQP